jgi:LysR family transcriptional regulator, regulator for bpeEF and oprC
MLSARQVDKSISGWHVVNQKLTLQLDMFRGPVPFVAVAQERSFHRAAVRLGVSVAAVSKAIQGLESRLGLSLFIRSGRSVALTWEAVFQRRGRRP